MWKPPTKLFQKLCSFYKLQSITWMQLKKPKDMFCELLETNQRTQATKLHSNRIFKYEKYQKCKMLIFQAQLILAERTFESSKTYQYPAKKLISQTMSVQLYPEAFGINA